MINKTINLLNYSFILLFFPSFVTGIFLPNLICGIFVFFNLFFNFQILKNIFLKYSLPAYCFVFLFLLWCQYSRNILFTH